VFFLLKKGKKPEQDPFRTKK